MKCLFFSNFHQMSLFPMSLFSRGASHNRYTNKRKAAQLLQILKARNVRLQATIDSSSHFFYFHVFISTIYSSHHKLAQHLHVSLNVPTYIYLVCSNAIMYIRKVNKFDSWKQNKNWFWNQWISYIVYKEKVPRTKPGSSLMSCSSYINNMKKATEKSTWQIFFPREYKPKKKLLLGLGLEIDVICMIHLCPCFFGSIFPENNRAQSQHNRVSSCFVYFSSLEKHVLFLFVCLSAKLKFSRLSRTRSRCVFSRHSYLLDVYYIECIHI